MKEDYLEDKETSQNINSTVLEDVTGSSDAIDIPIDHGIPTAPPPPNWGIVSPLSDEEESQLKAQRNTAEFQRGLQELLPKDQETEEDTSSVDLVDIISIWIKEFTATKKKENKTGIPDEMKARIEQISGYCLDDVRVHYNSAEPAKIRAFACTEGLNVYIAPGEEEHLEHELWHIVQKMEGRVQTTDTEDGKKYNTKKGLEIEATENTTKKLPYDKKTDQPLKKKVLSNSTVTPIQGMFETASELSGYLLLGVTLVGAMLTYFGIPQKVIAFVKKVRGLGLNVEEEFNRVKKEEQEIQSPKKEQDPVDDPVDDPTNGVGNDEELLFTTENSDPVSKSTPKKKTPPKKKVTEEVGLITDPDVQEETVVSPVVKKEITVENQLITDFITSSENSDQAQEFTNEIPQSARQSGKLTKNILKDQFVCWSLIKDGYPIRQVQWAVLILKREKEVALEWLNLLNNYEGEDVYKFVTMHKESLQYPYEFLADPKTSRGDKDLYNWILAYDDWMTQKSKKRATPRSGGRNTIGQQGGTPNSGSDCFMNSIIQLLATMDYNALPIPQALKDVVHKAATNSNIEEQEIKGLRAYLKTLGLVESATDLHEDAGEFLQKLLSNQVGGIGITTHRHIDQSDSMASTGIDKGPVPVDAINYVGGDLDTVEDPETMLKVPISEANGLVEWLNTTQGAGYKDRFNPPVTSYEWASVDNQWRSVRERTTTMTFTSLPNVLIIQLLRFDNYGNKIPKAFHMPDTFNLTEDQNPIFTDKTYKLSGVSYHHGNMKGGHYWTHRYDDNDTLKKYNDDNVSVSTPQNLGTEGDANYDLDHGYIYVYTRTADNVVLNKQQSVGTELYDRTQYFSVDEVVEDEDDTSTEEIESSSDTDKQRRQIWYGSGAFEANDNLQSKNSDTQPKKGLVNEGPCEAICADLVQCMEATNYAKHCMLGVMQGLSGVYYVTMSGRPRPEFSQAVALLRKKHSSLTFIEVLRSGIAPIQKPHGPYSDYAEIDQGNITTFRGLGQKGSKIGNSPTGVEIAKGMPGTCTLPKLINHTIMVNDAPKHVSEKWYALDNKPVSVKVGKSDVGSTEHDHGHSVASCKTCREIVSVQLQGVGTKIRQMEENLEKYRAEIEAENKRIQQGIERYVQLAMARMGVFIDSPNDLNKDLLEEGDYLKLRNWFLITLNAKVEEYIVELLAEEEKEKSSQDEESTSVSTSSSKLTSEQRRRLNKKKKKNRKKKSRKNEPQRITNEDSVDEIEVATPINRLLQEFADIEKTYKTFAKVAFSAPTMVVHDEEDLSLYGLIFESGQETVEEVEDPLQEQLDAYRDAFDDLFYALKDIDFEEEEN